MSFTVRNSGARSTAYRAAGVILLLLAGSAVSLAQQLPGYDFEGRIVDDVIPLLPENHRTQKAQIMGLIRTKPGQKYAQATVNEDLRRIIQTNNYDINNSFVEPKLTTDGKVLVYFHLLELPGTIKDIVFKGLKHGKQKDLESEVNLKKGAPMNPAANRLARERIVQYYHEKGRMLAQCYLEEGDKITDTRVVFNITEGPVTKVSKIEFEGHHFVSGARLKTQVHTSSAFLGLLGGTYNPEMTNADIIELKKYYASFGYLDVKVSREIKYDSSLRYVTVVFHIDEGQQYRVANVSIDGAKYAKEDELLRFVKLRPGDVYSESVISGDKQKIGAWYGFRGRDVNPDMHPFFPEDRPGEVDVHYQIEERPPAKVGEVKIIGNTVTKDNVIRRQLKDISPGQDLMYPNMKLAEANLARLGIFDIKQDQGIKPTVTVIDPDSPSEFKDLLVTVQEKPTGSLMFGIGANSSSGLTGNIVLNESNFDITRFPTSWDDLASGRAFRGAGQEFRISAMPGTVFQQYSVSFREPFLFDTPYSLGDSIYYYNRIFNEYTESRVGGQIQFGRQINRYWSGQLRTRIEGVGVHSVPEGAPPDYENLAGNTYFLLGLGGNVKRDTRDSFLRATEGSVLDFGAEEVLGAFSFPKLDANFSKYFTLYQRADGSGRHVLATRSQVSWAGSNAPVYERYFAGGFQTIRGFQFRGIGPNINGFMVGGDFMMLNSLEYQIPLRANDQIYFVSFIDTGTVETNVDIKNYRVSLGVGLRIVIPMLGPMPIALDLGFPVSQASTDRQQVFNFWVGYFH